MAAQVTNTFVIEVDGTQVPAELNIAAVAVEDHLHLPDAFAVTFRDSSRLALEDCRAKIGGKVKISVLNDASPKPTTLIEGEVTALEAEIHHGTSYTVVRGYDASHRLLHGRVTECYKSATYADIAKKVAQRHQLKAGDIQSTSPTHDHVTQANESDWAFLRRLADEVGFEVTVAESKLNFRKPATSTAAPGSGDLSSDDSLNLLVGANILELRATVTSAEQVKEIEVRGWDAGNKKAVVSVAPTKTDTIHNAQTPAEMANTFPGPKLVAVEVPLSTAKETDNAAGSLAERVAASFTEIEGMARGDPVLRAGTAVRIGLLGDPFDGKYVLTSTRHTYDAEEGYVTAFTISGRQERSLLNLTSGVPGNGRVPGVVPALVEDVDDPNQQGRVRLRFPWMAEQYVSDWCRVAHAGAGKDRGFLILPEVGDEVLVAFEQGEVRRPFVLNGLYNGQDKAKTGPGSLLDGSTKAINNRVFTSRKGHQLVFVDADDGCGVLITTADGKIKVNLDQSKSKVEVSCGGDVTVTADGDIKFDAKGSYEVKARSIKLEANSDLSAKGAQVSVEGSGEVKVAGAQVKLN